MAAAAPSRETAHAVLVAAGFQQLIVLSDLDRRFAVMLSQLSGCETYALHWVRLRQRQLDRSGSGWAHVVTADVLERWRSELCRDSLLQRALREPSCCWRAEAHMFLAESVVAEHVSLTNASGLPVPSGYVVQRFVALLGSLPQALPIAELRRRLSTNPNASKKWMRRFRERWSLQWGERCVPHGIGTSVQDRRANVFFRWFRWAVESAGCEHVIVVNMDETMLSNVTPHAKGNVAGSDACGDVASAIVKRQAPLPRTSLIAAICSEAALQSVLPQVRLPKGASEAVPSRPVQAAYAKAGYPQVARHGGSGWATAPVLLWWLSALRGAILKEKPGARIILVWDRCPTHVSGVVLQRAKSLGIRIVIIPSKMTWRLQPLDTHVFSRLKHTMRSLEFAARARASSGTLPVLERVELHGIAIRATLVETSWAEIMQRSGLSPRIEMVRDAVKQVYDTSIGAPAMPEAADLMDSLMLPASSVPELAEMLFWAASPTAPLEHAAGPAAAGPAADGALRSAGGGVPHAPVTLRLPSSARLPAAPGRAPAENVWAPPVLLPRVKTRSMTAVDAPEACTSAASASSQPAPKRRRSSSALL